MSEGAVFNLKLPACQTLADGITETLREAILGGLFEPRQRPAEGKRAYCLKGSRAPTARPTP